MNLKFFPTPANFRAWLEAHHEREEELWVGYYKKATGLESITWPESVDQALCFGWIDGLRKSIDSDSYRIRFTPRRINSIWSAVNLRRYAELEAMGLVHDAGKAAFSRRKEENSSRYSFEQENIELLAAYEVQFKANPKAWNFFQSLPPSVKKPSIWWVISAKREETRQRRLKILIESSEAGLRIPALRRS